MINALLYERVGADVFAVGDGTLDGFDAFFSDFAGIRKSIGYADDADGARRAQIQTVFFLIHGGIVKPRLAHVAHFDFGLGGRGIGMIGR